MGLNDAKQHMVLGASCGALCEDTEITELRPLSQREVEILTLLAAGLTNQGVAERLHVSLHTVRNHTVNIYRKLGVENRSQAVDRARLWGLIVSSLE